MGLFFLIFIFLIFLFLIYLYFFGYSNNNGDIVDINGIKYFDVDGFGKMIMLSNKNIGYDIRLNDIISGYVIKNGKIVKNMSLVDGILQGKWSKQDLYQPLTDELISDILSDKLQILVKTKNKKIKANIELLNK